MEETPCWHCRMSRLFRMTNHYKSAVEECRTAIEQDKDFPFAYSTLALAYATKEKWEQAVKKMSKALQMLESNPDMLKQYSGLYDTNTRELGNWQRELGNYEEALNAFRKFRKNWPGNYLVVMRMVEMLLELRNSGMTI